MRVGSATSLSLAMVVALDVGTLVKRVKTSKLTMMSSGWRVRPWKRVANWSQFVI